MDVVILGATGSVGRQTFEVLQNLPDFRIVGMAARSDHKGLMEMAEIAKPEFVTLYDRDGMDGLIECASMAGRGNIVVNAVVGSIGLKPTMAAINAGKNIALANKETLVAAGNLVMEAAKASGSKICPVDSEHSAIWQCLQGNDIATVRRLILTASGGAFRSLSKAEIAKAGAADALRHPNWSMGPKITIDCATMMNKGLEYIEARWLFDIPYEKIDILIHPQSIVHSMVEYDDGAVLAQMAAPDMAQPIQYALTHPERATRTFEPIDFSRGFTFEEPDFTRFPCLALAMQAAKTGGTMPAMMNALNEHLVGAYLRDEITFYDISRLIESAMETYTVKKLSSLADVDEAEAWAQEFWKRSNACR